MKILVGCERSGIVREAFRARGHDVTSCDLEPSLDDSSHHVVCDVRELLSEKWDMVIAFPPCTYFSGAAPHLNHPKHILPERAIKQREMLSLVIDLWNLAPRVCIENPLGALSVVWRKPTQIFQPYEFGDDAQKRTCFWLKNLDPIYPFFTLPGKRIVLITNGKKTENRYKNKDGVKDRRGSFERSIFHPKTAARMAELWG